MSAKMDHLAAVVLLSIVLASTAVRDSLILEDIAASTHAAASNKSLGDPCDEARCDGSIHYHDPRDGAQQTLANLNKCEPVDTHNRSLAEFLLEFPSGPKLGLSAYSQFYCKERCTLRIGKPPSADELYSSVQKALGGEVVWRDADGYCQPTREAVERATNTCAKPKCDGRINYTPADGNQRYASLSGCQIAECKYKGDTWKSVHNTTGGEVIKYFGNIRTGDSQWGQPKGSVVPQWNRSDLLEELPDAHERGLSLSGDVYCVERCTLTVPLSHDPSKSSSNLRTFHNQTVWRDGDGACQPKNIVNLGAVDEPKKEQIQRKTHPWSETLEPETKRTRGIDAESSDSDVVTPQEGSQYQKKPRRQLAVNGKRSKSPGSSLDTSHDSQARLAAQIADQEATEESGGLAEEFQCDDIVETTMEALGYTELGSQGDSFTIPSAVKGRIDQVDTASGEVHVVFETSKRTFPREDAWVVLPKLHLRKIPGQADPGMSETESQSDLDGQGQSDLDNGRTRGFAQKAAGKLDGHESKTTELVRQLKVKGWWRKEELKGAALPGWTLYVDRKNPSNKIWAPPKEANLQGWVVNHIDATTGKEQYYNYNTGRTLDRHPLEGAMVGELMSFANCNRKMAAQALKKSGYIMDNAKTILPASTTLSQDVKSGPVIFVQSVERFLDSDTIEITSGGNAHKSRIVNISRTTATPMIFLEDRIKQMFPEGSPVTVVKA